MSENLDELQRVIDELEQAQAKGEVWGGREDKHGEGWIPWRSERSALHAAGYWLEVEWVGDFRNGRYVASVQRTPVDALDIHTEIGSDYIEGSADNEGELELAAQAVLLRALKLAAQREHTASAASGWGGTRPGAGRPAEGDEPRDRGVSIKLTATELRALEAHAQRSGLSRSRAAAMLIARALELPS